jgi:predicted RNase H-like nuclease (RuvC/YqgF family)
MDKNEIYCFDCNKYFPNIDLFNQEHNKTINKVIGIKHDFLKPELTLQYISNLTKKVKSLSEELEKKDQQIKEFSKRLELVEDLNKGFFVECNVQIRNGKNLIKNI